MRFELCTHAINTKNTFLLVDLFGAVVVKIGLQIESWRQVITKNEVQVKIENLENKIEIKLESSLKKTTDGQNILSEWLATLSKKSEDNEKSLETLKKNLDSSGQDLEQVKTKFGQIVSKNEFQILENNFETKLKQNHDALSERFSILDKNFLENEKFGKSQMTKLENFCNEIHKKCNDKSKLVADDFKGELPMRKH